METDTGILTVSLDFELYWGLRDKRTLQTYRANLEGVENAIARMLALFDEYDIHATWATVGFLFAKDSEELHKSYPRRKPRYQNTRLDPYAYIQNSDRLEPRCHFAPQLLELICNHENQEIGTHTFSHYYCLERGQNTEEFDSDLHAAATIARTRNLHIKSFVFPRNQCNVEYLPILRDHGILCYRGNERSWLYRAVDQTRETLVRRAFRLIDSYVNLSGANSYAIHSIERRPPYNIPSSRFLRPVSKGRQVFGRLRQRRVLNAIREAASKREIFHLWWHPHNFGVNCDENMKVLEEIALFFSDMKKKHGMKSLNMGEIGQLIAGAAQP